MLRQIAIAFTLSLPKTIGIIAVVAAIIIGAFAFMMIGGRPVDPGNDEIVYVNIVDGTTSDQIAQQLESQGLIRSATVFKLKAKMSGDDSKFKSGSYAINKGMTTNHIIYLIANGKTAGKTFRVTEGQAIYKMAAELEDQEICSPSEFMHEVENGKFVHNSSVDKFLDALTIQKKFPF